MPSGYYKNNIRKEATLKGGGKRFEVKDQGNDNDLTHMIAISSIF